MRVSSVCLPVPLRTHSTVFTEDLPPQYTSVGEATKREEENGVQEKTAPAMDVIYFAERVLEFLIDLIGQLPTRRCIMPIMKNAHVLVRARLAAINHTPEAGVYRQLIELLDFYLRFEIDDDTGKDCTSTQRRQYAVMRSRTERKASTAVERQSLSLTLFFLSSSVDLRIGCICVCFFLLS